MSNHHEGVSCDSCLQSSFRGRRYKCLLCYDFDLCSTCYEAGITKQQHNADHPMQCIIARGDSDIYFGGETLLNPEQPQSFTCPFCCRMGFSNITLVEHVSKTHADNPYDVICPICVSVPGGDPNRTTEDLARHLTLDHRSRPRDIIPLLDEGIAIRVHDARRVAHLHPGYRGRTRPRRSNMQFTPGPLTGRSASLRDPVDPIAELLSHLSGVRRSTSNTNSGAFQQFQMQWQLDRHVNATRQQLERLSHHHQTRSPNVDGKINIESVSSVSNAVSNSTMQQSPNFTSKYLLSASFDELSLTDGANGSQLNKSRFVQELVLSSLSRAKIKCKTKELESCCDNEIPPVEKAKKIEDDDEHGTDKQDL